MTWSRGNRIFQACERHLLDERRNPRRLGVEVQARAELRIRGRPLAHRLPELIAEIRVDPRDRFPQRVDLRGRIVDHELHVPARGVGELGPRLGLRGLGVDERADVVVDRREPMFFLTFMLTYFWLIFGKLCRK